ncbi:MAG: hypothetical protein ACYCYR_10655 [Desulfobulbaceae bacterium]
MLDKYATNSSTIVQVAAPPKIPAVPGDQLRELAAFIDGQVVDSPAKITYGLLADFVADFRNPSVHKKKGRV